MIRLNGQFVEEMNGFKFLDSILCNYGSIERETDKSPVQGSKMVESLGHIMRGRTVIVEVKKALWDSIMGLMVASRTDVEHKSEV